MWLRHIFQHIIFSRQAFDFSHLCSIQKGDNDDTAFFYDLLKRVQKSLCFLTHVFLCIREHDAYQCTQIYFFWFYEICDSFFLTRLAMDGCTEGLDGFPRNLAVYGSNKYEFIHRIKFFVLIIFTYSRLKVNI